MYQVKGTEPNRTLMSGLMFTWLEVKWLLPLAAIAGVRG